MHSTLLFSAATIMLLNILSIIITVLEVFIFERIFTTSYLVIRQLI